MTNCTKWGIGADDDDDNDVDDDDDDDNDDVLGFGGFGCRVMLEVKSYCFPLVFLEI